MAQCRRKVFALGRFAAGLLSPANRTCQILSRLPTVIRRNWVSVGVSGGLCAVPFVQDKLSHEALIQRASSLVTDSASTYLSQTTLALVDSLTLLTEAIQTLITVHKRYVANVSKLNPAEEDAVWQVIIRQRQKVSKLREDCKQFESNWTMAIQLSELAAEAAFNAGADQASATLQSNLQMTRSHVEQVRQHCMEAQLELKDSKAEESERLQRAQSPATDEDEEIPEAYLRED